MEELIEPKQTNRVQKGWIKAILYTLGLLALTFAIQIIIGIGAAAILIVQTLLENGSNMEQFMENYQAEVMESGIINSAAAIASLITAVLYGLWYKLKYAKHYSREQLKCTLSTTFAARRLGFILLLAITCYILALNIMLVIEYISADTMNSYMEMAKVVFEDGPLTFIMAVLFAPIGEECLLRGVIQRKMERYFPMLAVLVIGSVSFGILHGNIVQGLYVLPLGMAAGYLSYRYQSVLPAILIHMIYNFIPNVFSLVPDAIAEQNWIWHIAAVILVGCVILLWKPVNEEVRTDAVEN